MASSEIEYSLMRDDGWYLVPVCPFLFFSVLSVLGQKIIRM
jgi:hypothetical protein